MAAPPLLQPSRLLVQLGLTELQQGVTTKPELAETSGEAEPFRSGAGGTNSTAVTADAMPVDEGRLREQFQQLLDVPHSRELLAKRG